MSVSINKELTMFLKYYTRFRKVKPKGKHKFKLIRIFVLFSS